MEDVKLTIRDVQAALLARFSDKTILIGHSLESDLHSLKVQAVILLLLYLLNYYNCILPLYTFQLMGIQDGFIDSDLCFGQLILNISVSHRGIISIVS